MLNLQYNEVLRMPIAISCAGDLEITKRLFEYLTLSMKSANASITIENDEIYVDNKQSNIKSEDVRDLLESFLTTNDDLADYAQTRLADLFTIGVKQNIDKLLISCEICGYLAHNDDELIIHKRAHALFVPL